VESTLESLERGLAPTEFTRDLLRSLRRHFHPGARMATAFAAWVDELLGRHGLVVFESADPAVKPLAADIFARELDNPGLTARLARDTGELMRTFGHAPQVEPVEDSVALFYLDGEGRRSIRRRGAEFLIGDATRPARDLQVEAERHPERFSPNVLLRPLVQDRLFPTVCYVCGPSELAYQAQLGGVYREFSVEVPLLYPRVNATLLDSGAIRFLERYGLALEALHAQDESALNRLLESQLPPGIEAGLQTTEREITERAASLKGLIAPLDPTLVGAVDTTVERIRETLHTLHTKIIHATKRKDDTLRRQFTRTRALAFPGGHPQERVLNVAFFVNRHGPSLGDRLIELLPVETDKHYVLRL
jgi:bacillithiol biosynthesis cysteine-adding enzyme BshC